MSPHQKIVLASHNKGKIQELRILLNPLNIELIAAEELGVTEVAETGITFLENALIKARQAATFTGLPAIADDSGLIVPYLKGEPGIYSARYAGDKANATDNMNKLLSRLKNVTGEGRNAFFYCTLVFIRHKLDPVPIIAEGKWVGHITLSQKGIQGFGYDPIFYVPTKNKTAAEMTMDAKNKMSHRAQAMHSLLQQMQNSL